MYNFPVDISPLKEESQLSKGVFLWIWSPEEKSPHVGMSLDGEYFALNINSKQMNWEVKIVLELAERKHKSVLFVQVNSSVSKGLMNKVFHSYESCITDNCFCTAPIFEILTPEIEKALLFDLLNRLTREKKLVMAFHLNSPSRFEGIPMYNAEDVHQNLAKLVH